MAIKRNEDIVHLYLMSSLYAGEGGKVKMGRLKNGKIIKWLFRTYIVYSICADILVLLGIIYLIFDL